MTTNAFLMALAAGAFAVFCVVAWHLVLMLKQARRTALAVEAFLESTRPRIEAATDKLNSLMSRADRILHNAETSSGGVGAVLGGVGSALAGWRAGGKFISTVSAVLAGIMGAWRSLRTTGDDSTAGATPAGGSNE